jgi:hypothetical protein
MLLPAAPQDLLLAGRLARTGLDAQRFHDLTNLLLVADCGRL